MEPKNWWFVDVSPFPSSMFMYFQYVQVLCLFSGVYFPYQWLMQTSSINIKKPSDCQPSQERWKRNNGTNTKSWCLLGQALRGVIIFPIQTMHKKKGNPAKFTMVWFPPKEVPLNDTCFNTPKTDGREHTHIMTGKRMDAGCAAAHPMDDHGSGFAIPYGLTPGLPPPLK